jgi:hypothetical protein
MEKIEIKKENKKSSKIAWLLVTIFAAILALSFFNGEKIHEKAVKEEIASQAVR